MIWASFAVVFSRVSSCCMCYPFKVCVCVCVCVSVAYHSGDDGDDCDDEDCSCHVCLFPVVVSYECIIPSVSPKVKPKQEPFWNYSRLDVTVGSCPSEHSTPSLWSDTIGAGDAVADVVDEASGSHCCSFVCSHYTYIIGISQALA